MNLDDSRKMCDVMLIKISAILHMEYYLRYLTVIYLFDDTKTIQLKSK